MDENQNNETVDLSGALKDSVIKGQFQEPTEIFYPGTPKLVRWVVKHSLGLIRDGRQANYVILGFVALGIVVSLFLFIKAARAPSPPPAHEIIDVAGPEAERY